MLSFELDAVSHRGFFPGRLLTLWETRSGRPLIGYLATGR